MTIAQKRITSETQTPHDLNIEQLAKQRKLKGVRIEA